MQKQVYVVLLVAWATILCIWSAILTDHGGGNVILGSVPLLGWILSIVSYGQWASDFGLMVWLWFICAVLLAVKKA